MNLGFRYYYIGIPLCVGFVFSRSLLRGAFLAEGRHAQ